MGLSMEPSVLSGTLVVFGPRSHLSTDPHLSLLGHYILPTVFSPQGVITVV